MPSILVIEDEQAIRETVMEMLELEGMQVAGAANGDAGIQLAREFLPDVIICDIMMPGRDGYGVLFELQSDPLTANIPFIFLTAMADRDSQRYGMTLGADDYVTKPFTPSELLSAVATRLEKRTRLEQEHADETEELRQSLLHTLPHELRTPLVAILGGAELLLLDNVAGEKAQVFQTAQLILKSGKRLQRTIENFLLLAQLDLIKDDTQRLESFRSAITRQPDNIVRKTAKAIARGYNREDDLKFTLYTGTVLISPDILERIVHELVDNAFKFSSPGQTVSISTGVDGNSFAFHVNDQGRGMSVDQIDKLGAFVQFERAAHEQQGSGLGMALARRLVELHDGILLIQSEPDRGTRVRVHLPAVSEE
jgi:signal transduction histidine kinase